MKDPFASLDSYDPLAQASRRQQQDMNRHGDPTAAAGTKDPAPATLGRQPARPALRMSNGSKKDPAKPQQKQPKTNIMDDLSGLEDL